MEAILDVQHKPACSKEIRFRSSRQLEPRVNYEWREGLDRGSFGGYEASRYQKDLPVSKAMSEEVLLAYAIHGEPLSKERGGSVRLIVPGSFGTNSTEWINKIHLADQRAKDTIFTTIFYNHNGDVGRPVWGVEINSTITRPEPNEVLVSGKEVRVEGWAGDEIGVEEVENSVDEGRSWVEARVDEGAEFSGQRYLRTMRLEKGRYSVVARARAKDGRVQPLNGHRNRCHRVEIEVG